VRGDDWLIAVIIMVALTIVALTAGYLLAQHAL